MGHLLRKFIIDKMFAYLAAAIPSMKGKTFSLMFEGYIFSLANNNGCLYPIETGNCKEAETNVYQWQALIRCVMFDFK